MNLSLLRVTQLALVFGLCAAAVSAQETPLTRTFTAGSMETYKIELTLRVDVRGVSTQTVGQKTYVKPVSHSMQATIAWTSHRRILSAPTGGVAQIEETETPVSSECGTAPAADEEAQKLQASLQEICSWLDAARTLHYEEQPNGMIRDLPSDAPLTFGEDAPPLLALWLRRNLRPGVIFPALPFRAGARSQRPVHASGMTGSETIEWADSATTASAATLHVVQELSWPQPAAKSGFSNAGGTPAGRTIFFADSNSSVSLLDGSVLNATRTASRETTRALGSVEGLPRAPEFSSKLTIVVVVRRVS